MSREFRIIFYKVLKTPVSVVTTYLSYDRNLSLLRPKARRSVTWLIEICWRDFESKMETFYPDFISRIPKQKTHNSSYYIYFLDKIMYKHHKSIIYYHNLCLSLLILLLWSVIYLLKGIVHILEVRYNLLQTNISNFKLYPVTVKKGDLVDFSYRRRKNRLIKFSYVGSSYETCSMVISVTHFVESSTVSYYRIPKNLISHKLLLLTQ